MWIHTGIHDKRLNGWTKTEKELYMLQANTENLGPPGSIEQNLLQVKHPTEILNGYEHYKRKKSQNILHYSGKILFNVGIKTTK